MIDLAHLGEGLAVIVTGAWGYLERRKRKASWDGETERRSDSPPPHPPGTITGRWVVELIDRERVEMPREWRLEMDGRIDNKVNNAVAMSMLRIESMVNTKVEKITEAMARLTGQVQRVLGRLEKADEQLDEGR